MDKINGTNMADKTDLEKKLGDKFAAYSILPKAEQRGFLIAYRLLEDEIDELTKEVERLKAHVLNDETINKIRLTITNAEARRIILTTH